MNISDLAEVLKTVKQLTKEAGDVILDIYAKDFSVDYKEDKSPITLADQKSNDLIVHKQKSR